MYHNMWTHILHQINKKEKLIMNSKINNINNIELNSTDQNEEAKMYAEAFAEALEEGTPIYSTSNPDKRLVIADNETFRQCWTDTPTRRTFPKYWFTSDYCNLVSMKNGKPKWIEGYKKNKTGKCYKYVIYDDNGEMKKKNIEAHNLLALVFESETYGRAAELLEQDGVYSFGTKNNEKLSNTGHHKLTRKNTPDNIQIITNQVHTLIDRVPNPNTSTLEQEAKFMQELGELARKEAPNKITVFFSGYSYNPDTNKYTKDVDKSIHATNSIKFTPYAMNQLQSMLSLLYNGGENE